MQNTDYVTLETNRDEAIPEPFLLSSQNYKQNKVFCSSHNIKGVLRNNWCFLFIMWFPDISDPSTCAFLWTCWHELESVHTSESAVINISWLHTLDRLHWYQFVLCLYSILVIALKYLKLCHTVIALTTMVWITFWFLGVTSHSFYLLSLWVYIWLGSYVVLLQTKRG